MIGDAGNNQVQTKERDVVKSQDFCSVLERLVNFQFISSLLEKGRKRRLKRDSYTFSASQLTDADDSEHNDNRATCSRG